MAAPGAAQGTWVPRARYRSDSISYRETLCQMLLDAAELGVKIPDDMPVDTPEHIQSAIVYVARLTGRHARDASVSMW